MYIYTDTYSLLTAIGYSPISGKPGVGVAGAPSSNGIMRTEVYALDPTPPRQPNVPMVTTFSNKVELQGQGTVDDGVGLLCYQVFRRNANDPNSPWEYKGNSPVPSFTDLTVQPGQTYVYIWRAHDRHLTYIDAPQFSVSTPLSGAPDPRQIGIRSTGAYWGAGGEQIDTQSGNLNYTLPILQAKSRGGWSASFVLNFNSQMWRRDLTNNMTWYYGRDNGYGHGWRLQAGSIRPVYSDYWVLAFYIYTDSTGAEYRLTINNGGVWTSDEGVFVSYDANASRIYFNDGSFWSMGAQSGGTEMDAGVLFPTLMGDTNGNQITVSYQNAANSPYPNSSSRISTVTDIVGTYSFLYGSGRLSSISPPGGGGLWQFGYTTGTANSPWNPGQNPQNVVQNLTSITNIPASATHSIGYYPSGELNEITLPYGGWLAWIYADWTFASQRTVREVNQRWMRKAPGEVATGHYFWNDPGDASRDYHYVRSIYDQTSAYDKVWWYNPDRTLGTFDERKAGGVVTVRKDFHYQRTPVSNQLYVWRTDTTLELGTPNAKTKRLDQALDQFGNLVGSTQTDYFTPGGSPTKFINYTISYLTDPNYVNRYIRNRMTQVLLVDSSGAPASVVASNEYDYSGPGCPGNYAFYPVQPNVTGHDSTNYGTAFPYRGNPTGSFAPGSSGCQKFDYLGMLRTNNVNGGSSSITPDPSKNYAVPSAVTANGYTTTMQWDGLLNLTNSTGPNGASVSFGYDAVSRPTSTSGVDGESATFSYSVSGRSQTNTTGKRYTKTYLDGFGRAVKVETGTNPTPGTAVVDSIVDTEYQPCACTPIGKMKRVSQPYKPGQTPVWTTYSYDELGRTVTVTLPPNAGTTGSSGTTSYEYVSNTVKVTDPAARWKRYTMDAFGYLTQVEEPKPAGGTYVTTYTYDKFAHLLTVNMTRDGYSGHTPVSVTQTRTFTYSTGNKLATTTFPETPGTTEYQYNNAYNLVSGKKDYKGIRKYFYDAAKRLIRVERYPGATDWNVTGDDRTGRVKYYYDSHPLSTNFSAQFTSGRLAAIEYNFDTVGFGQYREFYSYTRGGKLLKKRLEANGWKLEVSFEYDATGKMQYMVYPSGKRVKYTYDDLARHTGLKDVQGTAETDIVNNLTYGAAGELKTMNWQVTPTQWSSQSWNYNNRLQMTSYSYSGPGGPVSHSYLYSDLQNDGKLWRRQDNLSGEVAEYQYDSLHRLISAGVVGGTGVPGQEWGQQYIYDGFGNMKQKNGYAVAQYTGFNNALNSATNGGAGDPGDIDNRILVLNGETYDYAADNKRIRKTTSTLTHWYLWVGNMRVGTYTFSFNSQTSQYVMGVVKEDLYVAGRRVAPSDRLGSDVTGGVRLMPYGEDIASPPVANDRTKFATYHRDASGYDYADQRYYSPGSGRFLSGDPYLASGGPSSPGSWNRYAYVGGDPVNYVDPEGLKAASVVCSAEFSTEDCYGQGGGSTGNGNGGMYCDQGLLPFISTPAECSAYSAAVWAAASSPFRKISKQEREQEENRVKALLLAAAAAAASEEQDGQQYPKYLGVWSDTYSCFGKGIVQRNVTYQLYDNLDKPIASGTITEHLFQIDYDQNIWGNNTSPGRPNGRYEDEISIQWGYPRTYLQSFTVQGALSGLAGFVDVPVFVKGFGGEYGVLNITKTGSYVEINGNRGTPKQCN